MTQIGFFRHTKHLTDLEARAFAKLPLKNETLDSFGEEELTNILIPRHGNSLYVAQTKISNHIAECQECRRLAKQYIVPYSE